MDKNCHFEVTNDEGCIILGDISPDKYSRKYYFRSSKQFCEENKLTLNWVFFIEPSETYNVLAKMVLNAQATLTGSQLKITLPQDSKRLGLQFSFSEETIEPSIEIDLLKKPKLTLYCVGVTS